MVCSATLMRKRNKCEERRYYGPFMKGWALFQTTKLLFPAEPERDLPTKMERILRISAELMYSGHSGTENAKKQSYSTQESEQVYGRNPEFRRNNQYPKQDRMSNSGKQCTSGAVIPCLECFQLLHTLHTTPMRTRWSLGPIYLPSRDSPRSICSIVCCFCFHVCCLDWTQTVVWVPANNGNARISLNNVQQMDMFILRVYYLCVLED